MSHPARQLSQILLLSSAVLAIVSACASERVSLTSTPASSSMQHSQAPTQKQSPSQLEAAPIVHGLQLIYTIANAPVDGSGAMLRIRATLTNVGSVPRHLADSRVEERDRKGAGLLEVSSRFATDPQEEICGMDQAFENWHYTPLNLTLNPGESHTEEWVVSPQGVKAVRMDGTRRDGVICLSLATTYKLRLIVMPQDLDDGRRVSPGRDLYYPTTSIPGPLFLVQLNQLPTAPN